ncbi:hypothetical protein B0J13DRAFT_449139, partial [Dactylonectria estremocensis]
HRIQRKALEEVLGFAASYAAKYPLNDPYIAKLPTNSSLPIEGLPLLAGFCYSEPHCRFLIINKKNILAHLDKASYRLRGDSRSNWKPVSSTLLQMIQGCEAELKSAADESRRHAKAPKGVDSKSNWVKFIKWSAHLLRKARPILLKAAQPPISKVAKGRL